MGLMVAAISLAVAGFGLARWLRTDVSQWYEGKELLVGIGVIVVLTASFIVGNWLARSERLAGATAD
jgi:uncharacterized membrane protein AbrB (regulator of aidB expression)